MNAFGIFFVSSLRTKYLNTTVLTLHLKVFRVSDYCSLRHFLYIETRFIRTPRGMPYWDTKGTRHTGTPRGQAILWHQRDKPYWDTKGTRHTGTPRDTPYWDTKGTSHAGTPWRQAILGHQGDKPYWHTKGTRHTGTPRGHAIQAHQGDTPYWDTMGTSHTGTRQIVYVEMTETKSRQSGTYVRGSGNLYERATVLGSNTGGKAD